MPTDATLTRLETNLVFELVVKRDLDPNEFRWEDVKSEEFYEYGTMYFTASQLTHVTTNFYFRFGGMEVVYSPGPLRKIERQSHKHDWDIKGEKCWEWLGRVKEEVEAPDLWASLRKERRLLDAASSTSDNHPFTSSERSHIAVQLNELKQNLLTGQQFQAEQTALIGERFDYLAHASERLGRKDWLNNALGALVGLIVGLALDPEKAKGLLAMADGLFQWIWVGPHVLK